MENKNILIYGANGYTGKLFAKHLVEKGITPILAGRSDTVSPIGEMLDCPVRIFKTEDAETHLADVDVLVNIAGPFSKTQDGLIKGCIASKTHYLDIAGEVPEVENVFNYNDAAKKAGIILLPAAGFGVVPTDIAAKMACDLIENPTHLTIGYATQGGASRGTLKTVLKDIQKPGVVLKDNVYKEAKPAEKSIEEKIMDRSIKMVYNPWRADLYTAKISTGVSNIETYSEFPDFVVSMMKGKLNWLRNLLLKRLINFLPEGPSEKQLKKGKTYIKAIASNEKQERGTVELTGPEAYLFTIICLEKIVDQILTNTEEGGVKTPSQLGTDWMQSMDAVTIKTHV